MRDEPRRACATLMAAMTAVLFLLAACSSSGDSGSGSDSGSAPTQSDLDGSTFTTTSASGTGLVKDSTITLSFENGTMAVDGGCNNQSAHYEVDGRTLKWTSPAAATLKACPPELEAQDAALAAAFTSGVDATLDGKSLTLTNDDSDQAMTLVLEKN